MSFFWRCFPQQRFVRKPNRTWSVCSVSIFANNTVHKLQVWCQSGGFDCCGGLSDKLHGYPTRNNFWHLAELEIQVRQLIQQLLQEVSRLAICSWDRGGCLSSGQDYSKLVPEISGAGKGNLQVSERQIVSSQVCRWYGAPTEGWELCRFLWMRGCIWLPCCYMLLWSGVVCVLRSLSWSLVNSSCIFHGLEMVTDLSRCKFWSPWSTGELVSLWTEIILTSHQSPDIPCPEDSHASWVRSSTRLNIAGRLQCDLKEV